MLLMTSYLITIANDHHDGQGLKEQLLKMSRADVLSSTKTLRKTLRGVASTPPPPPLVRPRVKAISVSFVSSSRI